MSEHTILNADAILNDLLQYTDERDLKEYGLELDESKYFSYHGFRLLRHFQAAATTPNGGAVVSVRQPNSQGKRRITIERIPHADNVKIEQLRGFDDPQAISHVVRGEIHLSDQKPDINVRKVFFRDGRRAEIEFHRSMPRTDSQTEINDKRVEATWTGTDDSVVLAQLAFNLSRLSGSVGHRTNDDDKVTIDPNNNTARYIFNGTEGRSVPVQPEEWLPVDRTMTYRTKEMEGMQGEKSPGRKIPQVRLTLPDVEDCDALTATLEIKYSEKGKPATLSAACRRSAEPIAEFPVPPDIPWQTPSFYLVGNNPYLEKLDNWFSNLQPLLPYPTNRSSRDS